MISLKKPWFKKIKLFKTKEEVGRAIDNLEKSIKEKWKNYYHKTPR